MEFRLNERKGGALVDGTAHLKYLGRTLDQSDDN